MQEPVIENEIDKETITLKSEPALPPIKQKGCLHHLNKQLQENFKPLHLRKINFFVDMFWGPFFQFLDIDLVRR